MQRNASPDATIRRVGFQYQPILRLDDSHPEPVHVPQPPTPRRVREELDAVLRQRTPAARGTQAFLAVNLALFVAVALHSGSFPAFAPRDVLAWGAGYGPRTAGGEWWRLLTATFLHGGLPHLALNMAALIAVGPLVERLIGTRAFLAFYIACGLAGSAASLWYGPSRVAVGASGSIMGLCGLLLALMIERPPPAGCAPGAAAVPVTRAKLRVHLPWIIGAIVSTLWMGWLVPRIDNAAHTGGLVAGCLIGWMSGRHIERALPGRREIAAAVIVGLACCALALAADHLA